MRLLADENIPAAAVAALTDAGHDVVWIRTAAPGLSDADVLAWTAQERRILLTFDKDFGELARRMPLPRDCGVILLRMALPSPDRIGPWITGIMSARQDWPGHFSVVETDRVRMRKLETSR
ncbi:MAG: DUF5615 family PIN-like protein [Rhodospirillaceae bacterium]|nr:DUF5615 family PIN-like protein [Rhodospirillaceae bacterium]